MMSKTSKRPASDVAFTETVKAIQERRGSRAMYERVEQGDGWQTTITPDLESFLAERDSFYVATANAEGQPYIQHRGGPKGFLRALDEHTLAFADFAGNRQYITVGNLADNDRAFIFSMDYAHRRRVKIWGRARVIEGDEELTKKLSPASYKARIERVILFDVTAWDVNCPQHIPQKVDAREAAIIVMSLRDRIAELEAENAELRRRASAPS
ncbi:Flavodoxin reductase [Labilithrix luteola]|uniref:Flavodoxin reductase n=1 Tax=Labilithrix luteola TaxID=1391654 RepID=A0A0K1QEY7_9BACT|nr:pyridoxamine 5'-phosphate oxidase family protein [Labilithrix luteola]AKV04000.1 Flavodoxin reductase [Labilithrix luteola]